MFILQKLLKSSEQFDNYLIKVLNLVMNFRLNKWVKDTKVRLSEDLILVQLFKECQYPFASQSEIPYVHLLSLLAVASHMRFFGVTVSYSVFDNSGNNMVLSSNFNAPKTSIQIDLSLNLSSIITRYIEIN
jgi:hypothetical protein